MAKAKTYAMESYKNHGYIPEEKCSKDGCENKPTHRAFYYPTFMNGDAEWLGDYCDKHKDIDLSKIPADEVLKIQIKTIWGSVLWESDKETLKEAVVEKNNKDADLYGANLRGANLYGANLYGADLYGADLWQLPTDYINQCSRDILFILQSLRKEVPFLKKMLLEGKVDGTAYEGDCACLIGTLANGDGGLDAVCQAIPFYEKGTHNAGEAWFLNIKEGDMPEKNQFSAHVLKLIEMVEENKYYTIEYKPTKKQLADWEKKHEQKNS